MTIVLTDELFRSSIVATVFRAFFTFNYLEKGSKKGIGVFLIGQGLVGNEKTPMNSLVWMGGRAV